MASRTDNADVSLYRAMRLIRRAEEILMEQYHPHHEMRCPIHFCVGQEATPAALSFALQPDDVIMSHYRSHGYYLAKGGSLNEMVAEFFGKATGSNGGLAGSMELANHDRHFYSGAIVGGPLGLAIGSAFAQKSRGSGAITIAVFGDGAMDEGVVYESFNLASLYALPVLFLCENNGYAAHTATDRRTSAADLLGRAAAFAVRGKRVSDREPLALAAAIGSVIADVRRDGPFFMEVQTYRLCGHVGPESDDGLQYRPPAEIEAARKSDPLHALRNHLTASGADRRLAEIDAECDKLVWDAIRLARAAPFPSPEDADRARSANSYSPIVTAFTEPTRDAFQGGQAETRLAPY